MHKVDGHASASTVPALKERLDAGQQLTDSQMKTQKDYNEMLVDSIIDGVAFSFFYPGRPSRKLISTMGRKKGALLTHPWVVSVAWS